MNTISEPWSDSWISWRVSSAATELRIHSGAESARQVLSDVDFALRERTVEVLGISVYRDEFYAFHFAVDHVIHCIQSGTAHADDADAREGLYLRDDAFRHR
jgi:hypothetical protein